MCVCVDKTVSIGAYTIWAIVRPRYLNNSQHIEITSYDVEHNNNNDDDDDDDNNNKFNKYFQYLNQF